jgi:hypothetical protein
MLSVIITSGERPLTVLGLIPGAAAVASPEVAATILTADAKSVWVLYHQAPTAWETCTPSRVSSFFLLFCLFLE